MRATAETSVPLDYRHAVRRLLGEFAWNFWFIDTYWPENEPRVRLMARLAHAEMPLGTARRMLEVGCANGYVAYLFALLGFDVSALDSYDDEKRAELFRKGGVAYHASNLNDPSSLSGFSDSSFDLVLLGEVFEHILNEPARVLKEVRRLLRRDGVLILTTPNPSTLMNAIRTLRDRNVLWGTHEFLREPKVDSGKVIDRGEVHYREYPAWVVTDLLTELGYRVGHLSYIRTGISVTQSPGKRLVKYMLRLSRLSELRPFAPGYILCARR
jgi:2-polyprenyl-3-methyl-5-hydroxy-6-metoxy-1,4-benzoquinol methylase